MPPYETKVDSALHHFALKPPPLELLYGTIPCTAFKKGKEIQRQPLQATPFYLEKIVGKNFATTYSRVR